MNVEVKTTAGQAMGIIGIVLAVISLILAFIPCVGIVAFLPAGLALIFSVISIVQASNGYGSRSLGIGALIVSLLSILLAAVWLMVFSGTLVIADKTIKNADKIELFGKEFEKSIKEEFGDESINIDIDTDDLEATLRELEDTLNNLDDTLTDEEKIKKVAKASAKAIKKNSRIIISTDSTKVEIHVKE